MPIIDYSELPSGISLIASAHPTQAEGGGGGMDFHTKGTGVIIVPFKDYNSWFVIRFSTVSFILTPFRV